MPKAQSTATFAASDSVVTRFCGHIASRRKSAGISMPSYGSASLVAASSPSMRRRQMGLTFFGGSGGPGCSCALSPAVATATTATIVTVAATTDTIGRRQRRSRGGLRPICGRSVRQNRSRWERNAPRRRKPGLRQGCRGSPCRRSRDCRRRLRRRSHGRCRF